MDRLLWAALGHIRRGNLQITSARGSVFSFGDGSGPAIAARFTSAAAQYAALLDPELRLGEAYMNGTFVIEKGIDRGLHRPRHPRAC
jgi:cyclopropane-fatty-acyl-phospholipid synthase